MAVHALRTARAGGSAGIGSYQVAYDVTGSATCGPTGSSPPGGSATLDTNTETICCP